ncbi:hypothetical protein ILS70_21885 [Bacillus sp. 12RED03]|nr:hypothetical protein [Bacillus sp. 12RED03]MBY7135669.1 hypothetical protein [Bacillus sp. 12RED03]
MNNHNNNETNNSNRLLAIFLIVSPHAVLIFAILSTILLEAIFKLIDKFDTPNTKETI